MPATELHQRWYEYVVLAHVSAHTEYLDVAATIRIAGTCMHDNSLSARQWFLCGIHLRWSRRGNEGELDEQIEMRAAGWLDTAAASETAGWKDVYRCGVQVLQVVVQADRMFVQEESSNAGDQHLLKQVLCSCCWVKAALDTE